ncbi:alpha,alpha-phosphotrehalase [Lactococcus hodotermopsidis]|uniref:Alpha,alpha-phosphotrehalase n=1 Tax=Pseudolactococcus hodotermopsidis TaxID=2709157 RepID=A0A6A0BDV3_9LACT|nr:alpha,alpha-phosphotrehalase [Lactococcus hodotermopsidis]GFH42541.1 alpha,alpha-phosphotrehalase [Lactococcus hodotermopsidis]
MTFKNKVIYQIYPKSFLDTTGSGVGDICGIIKKLDYLAELGIDMIWLNPIYPSPQRDNGYDISDYVAINPDFGTMADFEALIAQGKKRGIEVMLDMVLNHVSIEHDWFQKAISGDTYYQDFFILRDEPTDWLSKFGGNAWAPFGDTGKYYLHLFDVTQADLNWRNVAVRNEMFKVVNFWRDKGVAGFRFDVINLIGKEAILQNNPVNEGKAEYTDKPLTHDYLQMLNAASFGKDEEAITVGEMSSTTIENCILYSRPDRNELSMTFNFHHLKVDYVDGQKWTKMPFDFAELKQLFHTWGEKMSEGNGWNALFWNNHDQPRAINRFIDHKNFRIKGAMMLAASIHLSRGTPYVYMGEEIGMIDPDFTSMQEYVDVESRNAYQMLMASGKSPEEAFAIIQTKSRDNSRTPMQWDDSVNAGFSTGRPWLMTGNHAEINVAHEKNGEIFTFYQKLIALRKSEKLISEGTYKAAYQESDCIYGFIREFSGQKMLVVNNFSNQVSQFELLPEFVNGEILINTYSKFMANELQPYQSVAFIV